MGTALPARGHRQPHLALRRGHPRGHRRILPPRRATLESRIPLFGQGGMRVCPCKALPKPNAPQLAKNHQDIGWYPGDTCVCPSTLSPQECPRCTSLFHPNTVLTPLTHFDGKIIPNLEYFP